MQQVAPAARSHYRRMQDLQVVALSAAFAGWASINQDFIAASWSETLTDLEPVVTETQRRAAAAGATYGAETLVQTSGEWRAPEAFVDPSAFAGRMSSGAPLLAGLMAPAYQALSQIGQGLSVADALSSGRTMLEGIIRTQVSDAGRVAAGVDAASRAGVGYIRMLNPPSCPRCAILAGRRYRWNQGFLRHPRCDCVHELATTRGLNAAESEGLLVDQYDYFDSLSEAEQNRLFGAANAEAIREGADMNRVVNARRGMSAAGDTTAELGTARGRRRAGLSISGERLTPQGILNRAGSRAETRRLLEQHGYLYPGGQTPGGAQIGWDYEGFGQMGRGGTRRGYRAAVLESQRTGVQNQGTLTAAQRRLQTSRLRYEAALEGRNPYGRGPATPAQQARAEREYRAWLYSGGEIFTK